MSITNSSEHYVGIVDLHYADAYVHHIRPVKTQLKMLTNDPQTQFYACNQLNATNLYGFSADGLSAGTAVSGVDNYDEPQHLRIANALNTAVTVTRYVPLGNMKDTYFGVDQDLMYGTDMYLRLWSNFAQRMCYYTTTPATPNLNTTVISGSLTVTNLYLYLALEENLSIKQSLLASLQRGSIKIPIPYTYAYRFSSAGGTANANISLTLTKNYGSAVKKITFVPYAAQEYSNFAFDNSNVNGTKVNQLQTSLDGRPTSDYVLNCYNPLSTVNPVVVAWSNPPTYLDDWREAEKFIRGSVLKSVSQFQRNWFYCDAWGIKCSDASDAHDIPEHLLMEGFDLAHTGKSIAAF